MKLFNMLLDTASNFEATVIPVLRMIFIALCVLGAIAVIIIVMSMESNPEGGTNVMTGATDSFYSQNQSSTREGRLKKMLIIFSIIVAVSAILCCCTYAFIGY